ncbi:hypothetical protein DMB92_05370 [Campylobacter sp. MIT 99-7217]|uniref:hypothetical protein n=1 Tax=Campylobacter sp. MIT 99-7217 TaxID=535091 RepID=UPI001158726E|nr:hypothetical protein [Campylobacter sp. MIT 99-7217]TQR31819.1 hypothetical protein DMB92_05370 [Campylobacter sp. MIT 99-7217]
MKIQLIDLIKDTYQRTSFVQYVRKNHIVDFEKQMVKRPAFQGYFINTHATHHLALVTNKQELQKIVNFKNKEAKEIKSKELKKAFAVVEKFLQENEI